MGKHCLQSLAIFFVTILQRQFSVTIGFLEVLSGNDLAKEKLNRLLCLHVSADTCYRKVPSLIEKRMP